MRPAWENQQRAAAKRGSATGSARQTAAERRARDTGAAMHCRILSFWGQTDTADDARELLREYVPIERLVLRPAGPHTQTVRDGGRLRHVRNGVSEVVQRPDKTPSTRRLRLNSE
ncbi:unnamed protein product [Mycena citricolor]|uniref:Uncharacterized protein n=1 Tax=Mycena citricolor TaxID=2018698 RepID=A0AAD2HRV9_9AGAR|nr:unnamed protein product [Mycena citricolor]CAK5280978.1 unnamed protein product [Mycena citricolor]